jgi:hypothetical protein
MGGKSDHLVPPDSYDSTENVVVVHYEAGAVRIAQEQGKKEYVDERVAGRHEGREERGVNTGMSGFENAREVAELPLTWGSKSWGGKSKTYVDVRVGLFLQQNLGLRTVPYTGTAVHLTAVF